jgi:hypothetical protein
MPRQITASERPLSRSANSKDVNRLLGEIEDDPILAPAARLEKGIADRDLQTCRFVCQRKSFRVAGYAKYGRPKSISPGRRSSRGPVVKPSSDANDVG